jgi:tetratricopeptide (TPR) repeat protein
MQGLRRSLTSLAFAGALIGACSLAPQGGDKPRGQDAPAASAAGAAPEPRLPVSAAMLSPSEMQVEPEARMDGARLADVESCAECHADVAAQWRSSAHAFASFNNPIYRVSVDKFRAEAGKEKSRFCGGCHDIPLMVDRVMDGEIDTADARAQSGVTCRTCHSVVHTRADGNGSYTLAASDIPIPPHGDGEAVKRHVARAAPAPLRTAEMCGTCHKVFLGAHSGNAHHLAGQDDLTPWMRSVYAGSSAQRIDDEIVEQDCRACHMPLEEAVQGDLAATAGKVASHRMLGGHTWLSAMRNDPATLERARAFLRGSASIDVAAATAADGARTLPADGAALSAGTRMVLDVVVRNQRVGHRFPGGTLDAQDTWIELTVHDARGRLVAEAGTEHERGGDDPSAHRLRALLADDDGKPLLEREVNRFRAVVFNHTLLPREATVVQYALELPAALAAADQPLRVAARLRHRSRMLPLQHAACAHAKKQPARSGRAAGPSRDRLPTLDVCAPQPITDVAEAEVWIGAGSSGRVAATRPAWKRLYEHALGMSRAVQERLDECRPSLDKALAEVERTGSARERAMVLAALGYVAARQGRTDEAQGWVDRAEALQPGHPALAHLRGEALSNVWRWDAAVPPLRAAALGAARDDSAWTLLALALGSAGDDRGALDAAQRGLSLQPRDPDLLRVQALSLEALRGPRAVEAREVYLDHRVADDTPRVRARCSASVPGCALERNPVHVHPLRPR